MEGQALVAARKFCRNFRWCVEECLGFVGPDFSGEGISAANLLSRLVRCAKRWLEVADLRVIERQGRE